MKNKLLLIVTSLVIGMQITVNAALPPQQSNFRNFGKELPGSYGAPVPLNANQNFNTIDMQQRQLGQYDTRGMGYQGYQQSDVEKANQSFGYQPSMQQTRQQSGAYGQGQGMFDYTTSSY